LIDAILRESPVLQLGYEALVGIREMIEGNPECLDAKLVSFFNSVLIERAQRKVREISYATRPCSS
jgi:hypothetical protein